MSMIEEWRRTPGRWATALVVVNLAALVALALAVVAAAVVVLILADAGAGAGPLAVVEAKACFPREGQNPQARRGRCAMYLEGPLTRFSDF